MLGLRKEPPLDPQVLEEAADWLMRLSERELSDHERAEWERWKVSSPERDRAWSRAQLLQSKFGGLPSSLAMWVGEAGSWRNRSNGQRTTVPTLASAAN